MTTPTTPATMDKNLDAACSTVAGEIAPTDDKASLLVADASWGGEHQQGPPGKTPHRTAASSYRVPAAPWVGFTRSSLVQPVQPRFVSSSISRRAGGRVSNTCVSSSSANGGSMPVSST